MLMVAAIGVSLAVWFSGRAANPPLPSNVVATPDRIATPSISLADQEQESTHAVANYRPKIQAQIDDVDAPVVDLLRGLPGVVRAEVGVRAEQPTGRVVHLRDWHFVPKDLYALDMKTATGRELTEEEIDRLHRQLLVDVEAVQNEQMALLRCLVKHHGLRRLYCEGLTARDVPNYKEKIAVLREMDRTQISELRKQLAEIRELLKDTDPNSERYGTVKKIEAEVRGLIDGYRLQLLELGAPGRLLIAGEIDGVLPLDDADLLDRAKPVTPEGKVRIDKEKVKARNDAQVTAVMQKGGVGLIVLGGAHDLSDSVRRLGQGRWEYVRVTTRQFQKIAE